MDHLLPPTYDRDLLDDRPAPRRVQFVDGVRRCRWCRARLGESAFSRDYCSRPCARERYGHDPRDI